MQEEQIGKLLKVTIDELAEKKASKGLFERLPVITGLIAALASFAGATLSITTAMETSEQQANLSRVQQEIEAKQEEINSRQFELDAKQIVLDRREVRTDENTRIARLQYTAKSYCPPIPLDDDEAWRLYDSCMHEIDGKDDIKSDTKRKSCVNKYVKCQENKS